ncbi:MAG: arylsulfatase [Opitutales bacterium]
MHYLKHLYLLGLLVAATSLHAAQRPNIVLIITDDQGYGDIGAHGNTMIDTPALDTLWAESVRLTDYHVDPTCAPTRSALMTGRFSTRTGIWHTIMGRSMMDSDELTLPEVLQQNGYATGLFGKWHLGDNYPFRPQDQGFETVVWHKAGGIGQGPDYWDNDYFDDTYWRGDTPEKFEGYCTDIWFAEGMQFIKENKDRPFFAYISTNAPHAPFIVDPKYSTPYLEKGVSNIMAKFYGMITNIDENVDRLRRFLEQEGLSENTIFIFTTDNGTSAGIKKKNQDGSWKGFNAGMSRGKGSNFEGGHRVPFFIHWPEGQLTEGRDITPLTAHIDILPTLLEMVDVEKPEGPPIDGISLKSLLYGDTSTYPATRTIAMHSQRVHTPQRWKTTAVMSNQWRLLGENELYNIQSDPGQKTNIASSHPEVVARLNQFYDQWWEGFQPDFEDRMYIVLGSETAPEVELMSHDWLVENVKQSPWNQRHVRAGLMSNGPWAVEIARTGKYQIDLFRWPEHLNKPMERTRAKIKIGDQELQQTLETTSTHASFKMELSKGPTLIQTWLTTTEGKTHGAYFAKVRRLED